MSAQDGTTRGAAEESADAPLTETEEQTSQRPASQPDEEAMAAGNMGGDTADTRQADDVSMDAYADFDEDDEFDQ